MEAGIFIIIATSLEWWLVCDLLETSDVIRSHGLVDRNFPAGNLGGQTDYTVNLKIVKDLT